MAYLRCVLIVRIHDAILEETTLLRILAGKRMVKAPVLVLGRDSYHDMPKVGASERVNVVLRPLEFHLRQRELHFHQLSTFLNAILSTATVQGITYLGPEWAANPVVRRDVAVTDLLRTSNADQFPERRDELLELLDIDLSWHVRRVRSSCL